MRALPNAISAEALRWPGEIPLPELPEGVTWEALYAKYCPPNVLETYKRGDGVIYAAHRGFIQFPDRPDNSYAAYQAACAEKAGLVEVDVALLRREHMEAEPVFIFGHDRTAERKTACSTAEFAQLLPNDILGTPHIVPEVVGTSFTPRIYVTDQKITNAIEGSQRLIESYRGVNIINDCKNAEASVFAATNSKHPLACAAALTQFYPYEYESGKHLHDDILANNPAPDWKQKTLFMPVVQVEGILKRQFKNTYPSPDPKTSFEHVLAAAKLWVDSMMLHGLRIWGITIPIAEIGERYDIDTGEARDEAGNVITDGEAKAKYFNDRILIELHRHVDAAYPELPIAMPVRAYDVCDNGVPCKWSPNSGRPEPWGKHTAFHKAMAQIGRARISKYRCDIIVSDLLPYSLAFEAWLAKGVTLPLSHDNPTANLRPA